MKYSPRSSLLAVLTAGLIVHANVAIASNTRPQANAQQGVSQTGSATEVVLSNLPNISPTDQAGIREEVVPRNPHFTDAAYEAAKAAASRDHVGTRPQDAAHLVGAPKRPTDGPSSTPGAFSNFLAQAQGCNGTTWGPSDMGLAVSSTYIVQAVNECISVYNKAGGLVSGPIDLCTLMGRAPNSGRAGCFDPRLLYDAQANKFVLVTSYQDSAGTGFVDIAAATNPTLLWVVHHLNRGAALPDYPTLGQTAFLNNKTNSVITVCDNLFGNNGSFTAECLFLPKKGVYAAPGFGFPVWNNFTLGGVIQNTLQPVNSYEVSDNPRAQYIVNTLNDNGGLCNAAGGGESGLLVWAGTGNTAAQSRLSGFFTGCTSTSTYTFPGSADNGTFCAACIETLDNRIDSQVFYNQGVLYPNIDTNNGGTSAVLGWRVHPYLDDNGQGCTGTVLCGNLTAVGIEKEFCYDCGGGTSVEAYMGAIGPDPENDWTLFATFSSNAFNTSPGQFYATNRVSWLNPFHDAGIFACQNNAPYSQFRWGDYAAAAPDDPGTNPAKIPAVYGSGMYVQANSNWGTCIAGVHPQDGP